MKTRIFPAIIGFALMIDGCNPKADHADLALRSHFIVEQMVRNDSALQRIQEVTLSSENPRIIAIREDSKKIAAWRQNYLKRDYVPTLIAYCDSIFKDPKTWARLSSPIYSN